MKLLTTNQVVLRIAIMVALSEAAIMLIFGAIPHQSSPYWVALADAALLALFSTPIIYTWIVHPLILTRDELLARAEEKAHTDPLTELANRRLLAKHMERDLASSVRHKVYGGVLVIDLDDFKIINDRHGHDAGDQVLVEIARRLESITRAEDLVARLGGDEFIVLISRLDPDERIARDKARQIAEKLIGLLTRPIEFDGRTLQVGASIGVRLLGSEGLDAETAIQDADRAMYDAKGAGKGLVVFYDDETDAEGRAAATGAASITAPCSPHRPAAPPR